MRGGVRRTCGVGVDFAPDRAEIGFFGVERDELWDPVGVVPTKEHTIADGRG